MSKAISVPVVPITRDLREKLKNHLSRLEGKKILLVGDVGLDEYVMGEVRRISPEAPVPVVEVDSEDLRLGLAANVAQNVRTLGGTPCLVSVIGADTGARLLNELFAKVQVSCDHLVLDESRPTTRKARIMAKHHHVVRVDYETRKFLSEAVEKRVLEVVEKQVGSCDAVIIEDYAKGVVTPSLIKKIIQIAHTAKKPVYVDPHRANGGDFYAGCDLIKPNFDEAVALSGLNYDDLRDHPNKVIEVGQALQKKTGAKHVVMTRGKDGMTIFSGDQIMQVPTFAKQVFDVTGAGDTVIATLALGLVSGLPLQEACVLANFAAGVVVGQVGCVPCTVGELKAAMDEE
jgi:rfaE bifunctional protein kinase chain/domain